VISDPDPGEARVVAQTQTAGEYGTFSIDASGAWSYALDNGNATVQALGADQSLTETFKVASVDGTASETITVTISGSNDVPVLAGATAAAVTEDGTLIATGTLAIADVDAGQSSYVAQGSVAATHGVFSVDTAGHWSYALNNGDPAVQALGAGKTLTDSFVVNAFDGTASETVTVTIHGTNDAPTIGGATTGTVKEDATVSATGVLTISDIDSGESHFVAQSGTAGSYGSFSVNAAGTWSYSLANSSTPVQSLGAGTNPTDTFTVVSADGTTRNVVITVNGSNDVPTLFGVTNGSVTEDSVLTAGKTLHRHSERRARRRHLRLYRALAGRRHHQGFHQRRGSDWHSQQYPGRAGHRHIEFRRHRTWILDRAVRSGGQRRGGRAARFGQADLRHIGPQSLLRRRWRCFGFRPDLARPSGAIRHDRGGEHHADGGMINVLSELRHHQREAVASCGELGA
jgi:VCBS repeat-containing protein